MQQRRVLVTGGSRGIGRAIALELARAGFEVVVNYRSGEAQAQEVCAAIAAAGGRARALGFDVSDGVATRAALSAELAASGAFWGVVHNAGITADGLFASMSEDAWRRVLSTSLDGFFHVVQPLTMPMVRLRQGGRIAVISSISGLVGNAGQVNYSAAKAGLIGATRALAQELASRQITVNAVAPGFIETEMLAQLSREQVLERVPMKRLGRPEEVASAVGWLFSEGAAYVTGQVLSMNGGMG